MLSRSLLVATHVISFLVVSSGVWASPTTRASPTAHAVSKPLTRDQLFAFRPSRYQEQASSLVLRLLDDPRRARFVLDHARFAKRDGHDLVHVMLRHGPTRPALMFRIGMVSPRGVAFDAFFKPRQEGYRDWATEIAACRLARYLGVSVAPCSERAVPRSVLGEALARLPAGDRARLRWSKDGRTIFGFFRLWAPHYRRGLGRRAASATLLMQLASLLRVAHRERILKSSFHRALADLFVFDFLIYNNDRRRNLGVLRDGARLRLFPTDFGDGLTASPAHKLLCRRLLFKMGLFRARLVSRLQKLDRAFVGRLLTHPTLGLLVPPKQITLLMAQRKRLLEHIAWVVKRYGRRALF